MLKRLFLCGCLPILVPLSITGCSLLAPDRPNPKVILPENWTINGQIESNLPYLAWWYKFDDNSLNKLIESGLQQNLSLIKAQANIQQAQGQLRTIELSWIPMLSAFAGSMNIAPLLPQPQGLYGAFIGYSSLNIFSQIAQQKAAKLNLLAQQAAFEGSKLDIITNIAIAYYTLIAEKEQYRLYQQYITDLEEKVEIQYKKSRGGLASIQSGVNAQQNLLEAQSQLKLIENNIIKSYNALNYLLADNPGTPYRLSDFAKVKTSYANVYSLPASIIGNRPDIVVAAYQYKYYAQNVTATYTQLLPSFQIAAGPGGGTSGGLPNIPSNYTTTYENLFVSWTLNPSIFGKAEAMDGSVKLAYTDYIDTVKKALQAINNDLATNKLTNERYTLIVAAYASALQKYKMQYQQYQGGLKPLSDTLEDKLTLDQAIIAVNQLKLAQMQAIIALYKDLGGGYRFNESEVITKN